MSITRLSLCLLSSASLGVAALLAQDAPATPELTLEDCVRRALQKNFDLEAQQYSTQIAKDSIDLAKDPYEPTVSLTASRSGSRNSATGSTPEITTSGTSTKLGVTQQLYSGTTVSLSSQLDRSRLDPSTSALNPAYDADMTVSVRQQLLQGFGTAVNEATLKRARVGYDRANLDYKSVALTVIQSTENAFYNLAFAREQLEVFKFSLALAQRLFDESTQRRKVGVATDLDVAQAEVGVANARRNVLLGDQAVKNSGEALLALIGQFELESALGATRLKEIGDALPVFASSYNLAKQNQPDLLSAQAGVEQARYDVTVAKDGTKPSLSIGGAVGFNGHRGSGGDAYNDAFNNRSNAWQVDVALSYPWGQVADKARYHQTVSALNQAQTRLRQLEQSIEVQVRSAVRAVETGAESVKISTQARQLSERQYELEKAKFDAGLSTSYLVLQAQNTLENSRVTELQSKVSLRTAYAALHRLEGSSLQRYAVNLP
jgi:outer membrane protein TolC